MAYVRPRVFSRKAPGMSYVRPRGSRLLDDILAESDDDEVQPVDHLAEKIENERKSGGFADHDRIGEHR